MLVCFRVENMNLRMDDMNQKENFLRLSLQTIDHRMTMLEEMALQNMDLLGQIRGYMSQYDTRSRHVSAGSTRSGSRMRLDSEDSGNDQMDLQQIEEQLAAGGQFPDQGVFSRRKLESSQSMDSSLTPELSSTMRSLPSPILVHSQKALKEDNLQKYTDFSKTPTSKSSLSLTRRLERQASLKQRRSLPRLAEQVHESDLSVSPNISKAASATNSLLERRHGNVPKLHIDNVESNSTAESVHVHEKGNLNQNATGVYSTAHMDTGTNLSSQQPAQLETTEIKPTASGEKLSPLSVDIPTPEMGQVSFYTGTSEYQPIHTIPFTPILTSRSAEYTTITDEIDTSCMMTRSPPRSPTSAAPYSECIWDEDKVENPASRSEKAALKQAEEMEHRRMEKVIRNRLRQISMDESDSISDIAKLVISEMESENVNTDHEDEVEEESIQGSSEDLSNIARSQTPEPTGPITFEATTASVEIRIRRASTLEDEKC